MNAKGLDIPALRHHLASKPGALLAEFTGGTGARKAAGGSFALSVCGHMQVAVSPAQPYPIPPSHPDAAVPNDVSFLETPCDVLVPAAVAGTIDAKVAEKLKVRLHLWLEWDRCPRCSAVVMIKPNASIFVD